MGFDFASLTLLLFLDSISEFLKILQRIQGSSDGSLDRSRTEGFKRASTSYFYDLYVELWVG
jgi:hypothetical protein